MKVLSIRQPWAWLIIHGGKDIENRSWTTKFRGRFYVHASKKIGYDAIAYCTNMYRHIKLPTDYECGGIIGSVELIDCVDQYQSPWFEGPKGFVLKDPKPLKFRPLSGKLGFFEVDK